MDGPSKIYDRFMYWVGMRTKNYRIHEFNSKRNKIALTLLEDTVFNVQSLLIYIILGYSECSDFITLKSSITKPVIDLCWVYDENEHC